MKRHVRQAAIGCCVLSMSACGAPAPAAPSPTPHAAASAVEGPIAATVDGEPIGLAEVEATARATGLTPIEALHRLEQERALWHRAEAASLDVDEEAQSAARRAAVQALLRARVEEPATEASIDPEEIAARYASTRASWARPERRASVHVLAAPRDPSDEAAAAAARRFAQAAIARLAAAADPAAEAQAIGREGAAGRSFSVRVETLAPAPRQGSLDEAYTAALFAIPAAGGVAPEPVTTRFGVHAIVLTSIVPAFEVSLEEATPILRRQLVAEHRAAALDALGRELAEHTPVAIDERAVAVAVAGDLDVPGAP